MSVCGCNHHGERKSSRSQAEHHTHEESQTPKVTFPIPSDTTEGLITLVDIENTANTPTTTDGSVETISTALMKVFQQLQEQRSITYKQFESAFKQHLEIKSPENSLEFSRYAQYITKRFSEISKRVRLVESKLQPIRPEWASRIRQIQLQEKSKLELTVSLQMLQFQYLVELDDEYNPVYQEQVFQLRSRWNEVIQNINDILIDIMADINYQD